MHRTSHRPVFVVLLAVVAFAAGCGSSSAPLPPAPVETPEPSPSAAPVASASSPEPSLEPEPSQEPLPSQAPSAAAASPSATPPPAVADTLVARIFMYPDVTAGRIPPMLSVYADGRVLSPSSSPDGAMGFVVRRLTPAGLATLRSELEASGFFAGDVEIPPTQVANSGYTTYTVSLRIGDGLVTARTTNFAMSAKGRALVDLAERWLHPERELPASAWVPGQSAYRASRWYLVLRLLPDFNSTQDVDSTALEAAVGDLAIFGRLVQTFEDGSMVRCASVDAVVVERIVAALAARGFVLGPGGAEYHADMRWVGGKGNVTLGAYVLLPDDDPATCPADITG